MIEEFEINENLFYLERFLYSLDMSFFDKEVVERLNLLKKLVHEKMYSSNNYPNRDLIDVKYKTVFYYED